jgi:hypothetical protein
MSAAFAPQPDTSHVYQIDAERRFEIQPSSPTHLQSFIAEMDGEAWLWCFRCERAFQLGEARSMASGSDAPTPIAAAKPWTSGRGTRFAPLSATSPSLLTTPCAIPSRRREHHQPG